ncbi:hypothetical protein [Bacillus nitroreducens]
MANDSKKESMDIFSNGALRGKPYLDIDRTISEGLSAYVDKETKKEDV